MVVNKIENKNEQKYIKKNMGGVGGGGLVNMVLNVHVVGGGGGGGGEGGGGELWYKYGKTYLGKSPYIKIF